MTHSNFVYGAKQFRRVLKAMSLWDKCAYYSLPTAQAQIFKNKWILNYKYSSVPMLFLDAYELAKSLYGWNVTEICKYSKKVIKESYSTYRHLDKLKILKQALGHMLLVGFYYFQKG